MLSILFIMFNIKLQQKFYLFFIFYIYIKISINDIIYIYHLILKKPLCQKNKYYNFINVI